MEIYVENIDQSVDILKRYPDHYKLVQWSIMYLENVIENYRNFADPHDQNNSNKTEFFSQRVQKLNQTLA